VGIQTIADLPALATVKESELEKDDKNLMIDLAGYSGNGQNSGCWKDNSRVNKELKASRNMADSRVGSNHASKRQTRSCHPFFHVVTQLLHFSIAP
jgi:hypothetical protein